MSLESCFDREAEIIEEQLESGEMDTEEYDRQMRELESEARDYMRQERNPYN